MDHTFIAISVAATLAAALAILVRAAFLAGRVPSADARFMGSFEKRKLFSRKNGGFVVDGTRKRLSDKDSFRNVAVVASTGAGKTAGFIIPNVLAIDGASMVVTDPSGAIYAKASGDLVARGFDVRVIDPSNPSSSDLYNPIDRADTATEIGEVANILVRSGGGA